MAVGTTAALLLAGGAASAGMSIAGGQAQSKNLKRQGEYNAQIYEQQAEMIKEKKKISDTQFIRSSAAARGTIVSRTAGKGMLLSGSPLAVLVDTETQMQFDKAIGDYNFNVEQNFASSGATYSRQTGGAQARLAAFTGYSNAFSTMLNTGASISAFNQKPKPMPKGKI